MSADKKTMVAKLQAILDKVGIKGIKLAEEGAVEFKATAKLKDGTEIFSTADEWAVGADVQVKNAEGVASAAADGEHMLEDGRVLVVADGKVTEIKEASEEDMTQEQMLDVVTTMAEAHKKLEDENQKLKVEMAALDVEKKKIEVELAVQKAEVVKLSKAPAAASVASAAADSASPKAQKSTKSFAQMTIVERMIAARTSAN